MTTVPVDEAVHRLRDLVVQAVAGQEVIIAAEDGAAVLLTPVSTRGVPRFGSARGMFTIADDFDDPLDDFRPYER
jgi:antitoxin (DNA-binding transcriptional repressor) of toxin-antitoxin stability system